MGVFEAVRECVSLLSRSDRRKLLLATGAQVTTSFLDLLGVLLLGLVGTLAVTTVQAQPLPTSLQTLVDSTGLGGLSQPQLLGALAILAALVLVGKSLVSSLLLRRVFVFLAGRQAIVTARLTKLLLSQPLTYVLQRSSQETAYALIQGAGAATLIILGQAVIIVSELSLLLLLGIALLVISPAVAVGSIIFFALVAALLQFGLGRWAARSGGAVAQADIASLDAVQEVMGAYKEVTVLDRRASYTGRIELLRWQAARAAADLQFIFALPKYVFEVALVVGGFALAGALFSTQNTVVAVGTLTLFLAAATRVMPSILRLQGAALTLRNAAGQAAPTLELARQLTARDPLEGDLREVRVATVASVGNYSGFQPDVVLDHVSLTYAGRSDPAVVDISLSVCAGTSVAIVGRSGAGKSTLADLILGVLEPTSGSVRIGDQSPVTAIATWPGAIAYVPQEVMLANGTIRDNVALGVPSPLIDDELVREALKRAHLSEVLEAEKIDLETVIGERGFRLSGGQRQRLGIARALYARPQLLVLDEATSALDAETEASISRTINDLEGVVTTFIIAHRLATVRSADKVVYLDQGRALSIGSFDHVKREVPAFYRQAQLLGLD